MSLNILHTLSSDTQWTKLIPKSITNNERGDSDDNDNSFTDQSSAYGIFEIV